MTACRMLIILVGIVFFTCSAYAKSPKIQYTSHRLTTEINEILKDLDSRATIGVYVKSMKHGDVLYTKNPNTSLIPASIIKIMTAEAALLYLGNEYKFPTRLLTDATAFKSENGVLAGNLFLVQSGDPSLTYYDLVDLLAALKAQQIRGIKGSFYIDNTAYDDENFGPGWDFNDKQYCYAAPINASIINHNCIMFKVTPARHAGQLAAIIQSPRYFYGTIQNSVMTKNRGAKACYVQMDNTSPGITVGGCIPEGHAMWGVNTVVEDILEYNRALILSLLQRFNIQITGEIEAGAIDKKLATLAVHESKPLHLIINDMLKKSDNIIAGSLLKKMGEFYTSQPGSWENGAEALKQILWKFAKVRTDNLVLVDGSGLSPKNKANPAQLMQVLDFAYHHYGTNYEFISALPIAGKDGTLKNRLRNVTAKVRAKTGTLALSGVVSLAGYAVGADKEPIAFVIMVNGQNGSTWKYREIEDKIVTAITKFAR
jgi:D-alanyl-D-alanine carboxypeptidase/D-alanyl-D-alanine-endopeptidase (penicillin-binding protein 4)